MPPALSPSTTSVVYVLPSTFTVTVASTIPVPVTVVGELSSSNLSPSAGESTSTLAGRTLIEPVASAEVSPSADCVAVRSCEPISNSSAPTVQVPSSSTVVGS